MKMIVKFCRGVFIISLFACLLCLTSCGAKAKLEEKEPEDTKSEKVSIAYLRALYIVTPVMIAQDIYVEGRVISSDGQGSFYKELVVEDETGGIPIRIELERSCEIYKQFSTVKVRCNSLVVGSYGGAVELGARSLEVSNQTQPIAQELLSSLISTTNAEYHDHTLPLKMGEIEPKHIGRYVEFEMVQFIDEEVGLAWSVREQSTTRHLVDEKGDTLMIRTSNKARFANESLPTGSGAISGVLGYFNGKYQLQLSQSADAFMEQPRFVPRRSGVQPKAYP